MAFHLIQAEKMQLITRFRRKMFKKVAAVMLLPVLTDYR
jgi:hypothetical protein